MPLLFSLCIKLKMFALKATGQVLGAANQFPTSLQASSFTPDGVLGMGFGILSIYHASPVIQTLVDNNAIPDPVFAFSLASSGAELRIGGVNSALYTGPLTYTSVTQKVGGTLSAEGVRAKYVVHRDFGKYPGMPSVPTEMLPLLRSLQSLIQAPHLSLGILARSDDSIAD